MIQYTLIAIVCQFTLIASLASAKSENLLIGVIRNFESNLTMKGIQVSVKGLALTTVTDHAGKFEFKLPADMSEVTLLLHGSWNLDPRAIRTYDNDVTVPVNKYVLVLLPNDNKIPDVITSYKESMFAEQAILGFDRVLKGVSKEIRYAFLFLRGVEKSKLEQYNDAKRDFSDALELNSTKGSDSYDNSYKYRVSAYNERGFVNIKLNKIEESISDFDRAIELDSRHSLAYNNRGYAYFLLKKWENAVNDYDMQMQINGADYKPYWEYRDAAFANL